METTKSKITVNLYGNKHRAEIHSSDPELSKIIQTFVALLQSHDFDLTDINDEFIKHAVGTSEYLYDPASTNTTDKFFFSGVAGKFIKRNKK